MHVAGLSVTAQIVTPDPPARTFERFEAGGLLELECEQLTVGAAVSISLPVGDTGQEGLAGAPITLLGHVAGVKRHRSVLIVHHQPWRGRLVVRFFPDGVGTRVVVESSLDQDGLTWLAHKRGYAPPERPRADRHRIGLLVSKSGSAAVFAQATEALAMLAVEEVNADGGIGGVLVDLVVADDASNSVVGTVAAMRLMRSGCRVVFACVTSATFNAAASALRNTGVLLVHTVLNEGGRLGTGVVRLGERPLAQLRAGVPALMAETGSCHWFFVGQRYSWSYGAHWAARRVVAEAGGSVVGETYQPLGTTGFAQVIEAIERSGTELILSSLVGHDEVFFERQCSHHGLRATTRTFALVLDEATQQLIGNSDADGVWAAFGYFQGFRDDGDLEQRYRTSADGGILPPLSSLSETTYEAILAYARATAIASPEDQASIRRQLLAHNESETATQQTVHRPILLAESRGGRLHPRSR
ncbi:ABC transporter substrate-binding protein [Rhodococcus sp. T2V]|uniref:ABC transporter substrate-binding protein n=1 Tax=Rhodococcus sp. T2V TaxID=3034164 RepID=UPI0023E0B773|nr:ABC transporter substrate-binding protein [Rhodococcus sp. T2V]MDF3306796.1 ABC transporter substrate-binding protein [Rhodococcus sp. T2V]